MTSQVKLKVCGITSYEDARMCLEVGAEFLGFNFFPPSPRYIAPKEAAAIIQKLPRKIISVGVFVNLPEPSDVLEILALSGAEIAQLHGDEDESYCRRVGMARVIKVIRPGLNFDPESLIGFPAEALLVDTFDKKLFGGTGRLANWEFAAEIAENANVFLAGGLSPENIGEAIAAVNPFAVDVNSGVESSPGKKDRMMLRELRLAINAD
jgi:phosphoribosylanthranilate isomerase